MLITNEQYNIVISGVEITNNVNIKAMFLDMSVDAPARAMWQAIKQFNGYSGCGRCKETGMHLDLGPGKKNSRRRCHVYSFNKEFAATTGHAGLRSHEEVKEQALEALRQRSQGKKDVRFNFFQKKEVSVMHVELKVC